MRREGGWTNATWSAGGLVLRVAVKPGTRDLIREARLASILPPDVGYPPVLESGVTEEHAWMLMRRVAGRNLGAVWPTLGWEDRISAKRQLWRRAQAIHAVDATLAQAYAASESPFYAPSPAKAAAQLARLESAGVLDARQVVVLSGVLGRFWTALPAAPRVLNHGDLCTENALWRDGQVVALLDLEFAVLAPVELDLNELVRAAYDPPERPDPLPDPNGSGRAQLREAVTEIALAAAGAQGSADRLLGYALLCDVWLVENELSQWDGQGSYADWAPYRALMALADGAGGCLAPVLERLGG
ncbi:MAG: phosphotransferase [Anaerolineae bacterium]|nr:phosphotransferase [Anaerolineae bacterium]